MPLPTYQSTPLAVRSPAVKSTTGTMMSDFISPVAKRRKLCSLDGSLLSRGGDNSYATDSELSFTFVDIDSDSEASLSVTTQQSIQAPDENRSSQLSNASAQLLGLSCCDSRCLAKFSLLEVECCRTLFQNRTYFKQQQYLLDTLSVTASKSKGENSHRNLQHNFTLAGKQLCKVAYLRILDISEKRMRNVTRLYVEGAAISQPRLSIKRNSTKHSNAIAWMERYFNRIGDKMPHLQQTHLPCFLSKKMVYELMVQDLTDEGVMKQEIISGSHFYAVWRDRFHNCIIPKVCICLILVYVQMYDHVF